MPKIGDEQFQSDVADSIFEDKNIVAQMTHEGAFIQREGQQAPDSDSVFSDSLELLNSAVAEQGTSPLEIGDEAAAEELTEEERLVSSPEERGVRRLEAEESRREQTEQSGQPQAQPESPEELTQEQYRQSIEQADGLIKEFGVNADHIKIAADLAPFLGDAVYQHAPVVASLASRATLGARDALLVAYQSGRIDPMGDLDFSKLPQAGPQAAIEASRMFTEICGEDAQLHPAKNPMLVGLALHNGVANVLHSASRKNSTDPKDVNDAEMCVRFCEALEEGQNGFVQPRTAEQDAVYREKAVRFVNSITPYVLEGSQKISAGLQARQAQVSRSNSGRERSQRIPAQFREGIKGTRAPKFSSNQDIFEPGVVAAATTQRL